MSLWKIISGVRSLSVLSFGLSAVAFVVFFVQAANSPVFDKQERKRALFLEKLSPSFGRTRGRTLSVLTFGKAGNIGSAEVSGFSQPEFWGRWTDGPVGTVRVKVPQQVEGDLIVHVRVIPYLFPPRLNRQSIDVLVDGQVVDTWVFERKREVTRRIAIPEKSWKSDANFVLEFKIASPTQPMALGENDDTRHLGLGLIWLKVSVEQKEKVSPE